MRRWKNDSGFTLVELMVVSAIIGILSAVAMPYYGALKARARSVEAKILLANSYTAQKSWSAEALSFTQCLSQIGFSPSATNNYYNVGFGAAAGTALSSSCGPTGALSCLGYTFGAASILASCATEADWAFPATMKSNSAYVLPANPAAAAVYLNNYGVFPGGYVTAITFQVIACGNVSSRSATEDAWYIDDSKNLVNYHPGFY